MQVDLRLYFSKNLFSKENNVKISLYTFANFLALFGLHAQTVGATK